MSSLCTFIFLLCSSQIKSLRPYPKSGTVCPSRPTSRSTTGFKVVVAFLDLTVDTPENERWSCVYENKMLPEEPHWDENGDDKTCEGRAKLKPTDIKRKTARASSTRTPSQMNCMINNTLP